MTDNISRMYELAKVEKTYRVDIGIWSNELNKRLPSIIHIPEKDIKSYENKETTPIIDYLYPPFTAEKQFNLIKWILKNENDITLYLTNNGYGVMTFSTDFDNGFETLEDCLAFAICCQWELLTPEQMEEVRGILQ